ncbi:hypothetical protein [Saccharopolyspora pogona]|uniref:hypothetical protein n=1 Tax=Saccharopolyspora pogona TaxID=333966 RepID=UPI00168294FD|nr:hypothetical protein [Saccharopolyspora pogona]
MSDEATTPETTTTEAPVTETTADELPQWARDSLTKANDEAAKARIKAGKAEEKARLEITSEYETKLSTLSDEKSAITAELNAAHLDGMRLRAALSAGIPGESVVEFAELLKGETQEDLTAHAEKVKGLMGSQKPKVVDRSQGLGCGTASPADGFGLFINSRLSK